MKLKDHIHSKCLGMIQEKLDNLHRELGDLELSYGVETKSSAGDKYETNREMIHQEKGKIAGRLEEVQKQAKVLNQIKVEKSAAAIGLGSLVRTSSGWYYLSVGLGALEVLGHSVFAISPVSPIGKALVSKTVGSSFEINGIAQEILEVH